MVRATEISIDKPSKKGQFVEYKSPLYLGRYKMRLFCPYCFNLNTYMGCDIDCKYCYARDIQEKKHTPFGNIRTIDLTDLRNRFLGAMRGTYTDRIASCIQLGVPIKLGAMSDAFQEVERTYKTSLGVLRLMRDLHYPVIINTKGPTMLLEADYLNCLKSLPAVVQVSITSSDDVAAQIEPGAVSTTARINAMQKLVLAGIPVQARITPTFPLFEEQAEKLVRAAYAAGVNDVLMDTVKLSASTAKRLSNALGYDYIAKAERNGIIFDRNGTSLSPSCGWIHRREMEIGKLCDSLGMRLLTMTDYTNTIRKETPWTSCCGVEKYLGPSNMSWTLLVRGYRIKRHTTFEEYISGSGCPYIPDFKRKWDKGELLTTLPGLSFHPSDKTYSRLKPHINGVVYTDSDGERLPDNEIEYWHKSDL